MKTQSLKISSGDLVEGGQTFGELVFEPLSGAKAKLVSLIALLGNEVQNTGPSPRPSLAHPQALQNPEARLVCLAAHVIHFASSGNTTRVPSSIRVPGGKTSQCPHVSIQQQLPHIKCIRLGHSSHTDVRLLLNMHISGGLV